MVRAGIAVSLEAVVPPGVMADLGVVSLGMVVRAAIAGRRAAPGVLRPAIGLMASQMLLFVAGRGAWTGRVEQVVRELLHRGGQHAGVSRRGNTHPYRPGDQAGSQPGANAGRQPGRPA